MKNLLLTWVDPKLIADGLLVLGGFFWCAIAVVGDSTGVPLGYHLWQQLWIPLFNPAIGILMLGALSSWAIKKVAAWMTAKAN
ncbi:MAG: hypothetical protein ACK58N_05775 [Synechocystis sp.]